MDRGCYADFGTLGTLVPIGTSEARLFLGLSRWIEGLNYSLAYDAFLGHEPVLYSILKSVMLSSVACALLIPLLPCWPSLVVRAEL
jgi:hypothetical protein